jgi:pyruvate dehydrogenase E2 component (dihydrolipoamide acetyltransferase)
MSTEVLVPPLGQTVDTVTLTAWYKQAGDSVRQGEALFAVETDKAVLDVEAPASGVLGQVSAAAGQEVAALGRIAVIFAPGEEIASAASPHSGPQAGRSARESQPSDAARLASEKEGHPPGQPDMAGRRQFVSPRARRVAEQSHAPLDQIRPTGPEGAIIERDVRAYLATLAEAGQGDRHEAAPLNRQISPVALRIAEEAGLDWRQITGSGPRGCVVREDVETALAAGAHTAPPQAAPPQAAPPQAAPTGAVSTDEPIEIIPLAGVRGLTARRMVAGHSQTAPVTLTSEADASALVALRDQLAADGVAVSYNDLLLRIVGRCLREQPRLNASLDGDTIKVWRRVDVALAVDTERGLLAPVVRGVDGKGLAQLAAETTDLVARARAGRCTLDELSGGTFTVTNLGMYGIDAFTPIINLPETAILGVGRIKLRPVMAGEQVVGRHMVWLSLTFDHRLIDGGPAARFLQRVVQLIEKPHLLMA